MGSCIICGVSVEGRICDSHQEDVVFEFRGNSPHELVTGRFYRGTVDGYADFGVFVDLAPGVTGLLHRSELDRRLESLDWEPGDSVYVQVKNVRDNGNVDLSWSIRQAKHDFRGTLVQEDGTEREHDFETDDGVEEGGEADEVTVKVDETGDEPEQIDDEPEQIDDEPEQIDDEPEHMSEEAEEVSEASERISEEAKSAAEATGESAESEPIEAYSESETTGEIADSEPTGESADSEPTGESVESEPTGQVQRVTIDELSSRVDDEVRVEGEVVSVRQTGGPTIIELRDETGIVDCAAFVEAGVRAYPDVEVGDAVRLDGEVELRRDEIQVETDALTVLEGEDAETVRRRLADALAEKARPDGLKPLTDDETVQELSDDLLDAAEAIRRAVLESRPIVVRHPATADGYVAGAAVERAALPLIREEHAKSDAVYHYFDRRPLEDAVYDMDDATNDTTRMLEDRDRHDEKLPLFLLVGTGSTVESGDGLGLLDVYGAKRVVVDAAVADPEVQETVDALVSPELADTDGHLSTAALTANLAAAVNGDVRDDLSHLPAIGYWEATPDAYVDLAREAGYDAERIAELREAIALEAYYQSYEDKRELVTDLLYEDSGNLAGHVSEQFREKLETEIETAEANIERESVGGVEFAVLDTDSYSHRFDFPPTGLLLDELHRRNREDTFVTIGVSMDELYIRATEDVSVRAVAAKAAEIAPEAHINVAGLREGRIEFLSGECDAVEDAVIAAVAEQL